MATSNMLKAMGLQTFANYLSEIPEGSLLEANNVIIDRNGIIEPRRGIKQLVDLNSPPKQLLNYRDRILIHYGTSLAFQNSIDGNVFTNFIGSLEETETNLRIKAVEQNGNFYITAKNGIKKIQGLNANYMTDAGGIQAYDLDLSMDMSSETGFFGPLTDGTNDVEVAYRVTWGTKDLNENFIEGTPSSRAVIQNFTSSYRNIIISFYVPESINTDYFFRLYRTAVGVSGGSGDEMRLVFEAPFKTTAVVAQDGYLYSSGSIIMTDNVTNTIRDVGNSLYTNQFSGEGILQTNDAPPFAKDIASFKNSLFYANTKTKHKIENTLTGLDGAETFLISPDATTSSNQISLIDTRTAIPLVGVGTNVQAEPTTNFGAGSGPFTLNVNNNEFVGMPFSCGGYASNTQLVVVGIIFNNVVASNNISYSIYNTSAGIPVGSPIATTVTGAANSSLSFDTNVILNSSTLYAIVLNPLTNTSLTIQYDDATTFGYHYTGGSWVSIGGTFDGSITVANAVATNNVLVNVANLFVNQTVTSANFPVGTYIQSINSASRITLNNPMSIIAPTMNLTFGDTTINHGLVAGNKIAIASTVSGISGIYTVASTTSTSITTVESIPNGTTIEQIGKSYLTLNKTTPHRYFIMGLPEIWGFEAKSKNVIVDGSYYSISSINNKVDYYFWFSNKKKITINSGSNSSPGLNGTNHHIIYNSHGFTNGTQIKFTNDSLGLPAEITKDITYYVINATANDFQIALSAGGTAVQFTAGTSGNAYILAVNGASDPLLSNRVGIKIDLNDLIPSSNNALEVAELIRLAIEGTNDFTISNNTNLTIQNTVFLYISTVTSGIVNNTGANFDSTLQILQHGFGEDTTLGFFRLSSYISPAQRIEDSIRSLVNVINKTTSSEVKAFYTSQSTDLPGKFLIESKLLDEVSFTLIANNATFGAMFNPNLATIQTSTSTTNVNKLYFSKTNQPEAVPSTNSIFVGPKDKAILRIIALRDSLFILKEEAIYRLTGFDPTSFSVTIFDNSSNIIAPDTATVLNNQIYMLTTQGVATISETGVGIISRPIENIINKITSPLYTQYPHISFGISYETDRAYLLYIPSNTTDTYATKCYRYNTFTQTWTSWDAATKCGLVETNKNKLYLGAADIDAVEVERKTVTSRDYADREYSRNILSGASNQIFLDSVSNIETGDVITQTQYLTPSIYNRLINKLKIDSSVMNNQAIIALQQITIPGSSLVVYMNALVSALNIVDSGYVYNGSNNFASIQTQFNTIVNKINLSTAFAFNDYELSSGTFEVDIIIDSRNLGNNSIITSAIPLYLIGSALHYKAIHTNVVWAPTSFGDPTIGKHIRQGTLLLESNDIFTGKIGYASDLSGNFEDIDFSSYGQGNWGNNVFGATPWGGKGTSYPVRTLIPRQKQRCRYIKARLHHQVAFFKFSILGISYTFEPTSDRFYR